MGMQISNFSTFLSLCDSKWADSSVEKMIGQFKLTVIVLCDPNDPNYINKFDFLDRATGPDLLFITFSNWINHNTHFRKWITQQMTKMEQSDGTMERFRCMNRTSSIDDIEMADLARRFNINPMHLPALVITNDLRSKEAVVLRTTREEIGKQLLDLTNEVVERNAPIDLHDLAFVKANPNVVFCGFQASASHILTDTYCRLRLREEPNEIEAKDWNDRAVNLSIEKLNTMDDSTESAMNERTNELMNYATGRLAQGGTTIGNNQFFIDESKVSGVENDSLTSLRTYNLLVHLFAPSPDADTQKDFKFDYSAMSLYLGKVFENELAYSIVQQMRQAKGIPMPNYYCLVYNSNHNDKDFKVKTGENNIVDLNQSNNGIWIAPPLGQMRKAYIKLRDEGSNIETFAPEFLHRIWNPLVLQRNLAAHRSPIGWNDFLNTYSYFLRFIDKGYCKQLIDIKNSLRPRIEEQLFLSYS